MIALAVIQSAKKPGRGAIYRIAKDLLQKRAFLGQRLPALRSFFATRTRLKNADYRELFSLTRQASLRELRLLVEQGFLRMEGERRADHYVPLPPLGVEVE
jgi:hypothetical protein